MVPAQKEKSRMILISKIPIIVNDWMLYLKIFRKTTILSKFSSLLIFKYLF